MSDTGRHQAASLAGKAVLLGTLAAVGACGPVVRGQTALTDQGCVQTRKGPVCNLASFQRVLAHATTIAVNASSRDRIADAELKELVRALGKTVAAEGAPADLTVQIVPAESNGVSIGPSGVDLALLRVYAARPDGAAGSLFWVETYSGQQNMSWPAVVHGVIAQFQKTLKKT